MASRTTQAVILSAAVLLGGCGYTSDILWPSLTGDSPAASAQTKAASTTGTPAPGTKVEIPPSAAELAGGSTSAPPTAGGPFGPGEIAPLTPTGTLVGQKVEALHAQLVALNQSVAQHESALRAVRAQTAGDAERYHGTVAAVTTRLQLGTTRGNPVLVGQWNTAQSDLDHLSSDIATMNTLANAVASDAANASYLLGAARVTLGLSGAIDEDHRQLSTIEDETDRIVVSIDRLLTDLNGDVARQTAYVGNERSNLTTLAMAVKNGQLYGVSLTNRAFEASLQPPPGRLVSARPMAERQALVVIRFDRPNVPYQGALYTAVSKALQRQPQAAFDVVAVAAAQGSPAQAALNQAQSRRNADKVVQSLTDMGLPPGRVTVSATTSSEVTTNEVEIYAR